MDGIRLAKERDVPALSALWKVCFHDPDDYIRFFYRECFDRVTAAVYTVNDLPVCMLHWFDACFVNGKERRDAKFLYAGGTLPEYRRNGYYKALFLYAEELARKNDCALFGKPASGDLIPYYQKLGFEPDARFRLVTLRPGKKIPIDVYPIAPEEYNRMRDAAFSSHPHVEWSDDHVRFCFDENAFFKGKALRVRLDGAEHFLMGVKEGSFLRITETDLSLAQLKSAGGALCALFGVERIKAYLPDYSCFEGDEIVSSIVYNTPLKNTYVNLILI